MAKALGFITCTTLLVASVWVANSSAPVTTIRAGSGIDSDGQGQFQIRDLGSERPVTAQDFLQLGKRLYLTGRNAEAVQALEKAQTAPGKLNVFQRADLKRYLRYLARIREEQQLNAGSAGPSNASTRRSIAAGRGAVSSSVSSNNAHVIARQILDDARKFAVRGNVARATQLAKRADSFRVNWRADELSPAQFLAQLRSGKRPGDLGTSLAGSKLPVDSGRRESNPFAGPSEFNPPSTGSSTRNTPRSFSETVRPGVRQVDANEFRPQINPRTADLSSTAAGNRNGGMPVIRSSIGAAGFAPKKLRAMKLLRLARADLAAGHYEAARTKVAEAQAADVSWDLFEDKPHLVLAAVERQSGLIKLERSTETRPQQRRALPMPVDISQQNRPTAEPFLVAETTPKSPAVSPLPAKPFAGVSPSEEQFIKRTMEPVPQRGSEINTAKKQRSNAMLEQALADARRGQFESARAKVAAAEKLDVVYGLFNDRPQLVLEEVNRLAANAALAQRKTIPFPPFAEEPAPAVPVAESVKRNTALSRKVQTLLIEARVDLRAGRIAQARQKAEEAAGYDVTIDLFEDRPSLVLSEIAQAERDANTMIGGANNAKQGTMTNPSSPPFPPTNPIRPPENLSDKRLAQVLLKQARQEIKAARLNKAWEKANEAKQLKVTYGFLEDRPALVLAEIKRILEKNPAQQTTTNPFGPTSPRMPATDPIVAAPGIARPLPSTNNSDYPFATSPDVTERVTVVHSTGVNALERYNRGLLELRRGHRDAAYTAFLEAYQSGQQLDPYQSQQLQDFLRTLRPRRQQPITLVQSQTDGGVSVNPAENREPGKIDIVDRQLAVKIDRLRTEMLNAVFRAERLKEKKPEIALDILEQTMAEVESSDLPKGMLSPLLRQLQKSKLSVQTYMKQHESIFALKRRNEEVRSIIQREREMQVHVEQELADLVEDYNQLMRQRRYAEAEVLAKQAEDLNTDNPVVVTMKWKARFARRIARDNRTRDFKEDSFVRTMQDIDDDVINNVIDSPIDFGDPKKWAEITERRKKYGSPDNRTRTEQELRIEKSLNRQISLHFDEAPLSEVMKHVQAVTDTNIWIDGMGLQEEGVTTDHPVSIHIEGIMLRSALNLLLKPLNLAYTIEDEVLKITSRMREQGQQIVVTYPVADLVVPIPNFSGAGALGMSPNGTPFNGFGALGAGNMSVSGFGGLQSPAGAQFQVNDPVNGNGFVTDPWGGGGMNASRTSGGSAADFDALSELITATIEPDSWNEVAGQGSIREFETTLSLVIRQTQKVHDEIKDLLEQLRRLQDLQVTIEVRFITVADRFFERIGIDFDFNVQDTVGDDPTAQPFGSVMPFVQQQGQQGQIGQQGQQNQAGGIMGRAFADGVVSPFAIGLGGSNPAIGMGGIGGQGQQQQGQQQQGQQQQGQQQQGVVGITGFFDPPPLRNLPALDNYPKGGTIIGLTAPGMFTPDLDIAFRQGSFDIGVPDFGGFNPDAGIQVGLAILSDIEAFFFIQAAQGDERSNLMFAPKVTLFNGQTAFVTDSVQRPFVTSLTPTVGFFSVGFTPQITVLQEGVSLTVTAVISADRRFVRLTVVPSFTNITDVFTFSFVSGGQGAQQGVQGLGGQQGQGGQQGFQGGQQGGQQQGVGGIGGLVGGQQGGQVGQQGQQQGQVGQQGQQNQQAAQNITVQQPVFEIVTVTTTVSVPDGGTVLLGGVKRLREGRNMAGVPILNKIPYISRLFKNTGVGRETESLMLMVTPRIIIQEEEEELLGIEID